MSDYDCKICHTTNKDHFYPNSHKTCKICKDLDNRKRGITSITKLTSPLLYCIECKANYPRDNFGISSTGFPYDKCIKCKMNAKPSSSKDELCQTETTFINSSLQNPSIIVLSSDSSKSKNSLLENNVYIPYSLEQIDKYRDWLLSVVGRQITNYEIDLL